MRRRGSLPMVLWFGLVLGAQASPKVQPAGEETNLLELPADKQWVLQFRVRPIVPASRFSTRERRGPEGWYATGYWFQEASFVPALKIALESNRCGILFEPSFAKARHLYETFRTGHDFAVPGELLFPVRADVSSRLPQDTEFSLRLSAKFDDDIGRPESDFFIRALHCQIVASTYGKGAPTSEKVTMTQVQETFGNEIALYGLEPTVTTRAEAERLIFE